MLEHCCTTASFAYNNSGLSWQGSLLVLSALPGFPWVLLGTGEPNKVEPFQAACLQAHPASWQASVYFISANQG